MRKFAVASLALLLAACEGPSLADFNAHGGVINYRLAVNSRQEIQSIADRYCATQKRRGQLGASNIGMNSMQMRFDCVD